MITHALGTPAGIVTRLLAALIDAVVAAALTGAVLGAAVAAVFVVNPVSFRWPQELAAQTSLLAFVVAIAYLTVGWATGGARRRRGRARRAGRLARRRQARLDPVGMPGGALRPLPARPAVGGGQRAASLGAGSAGAVGGAV